MREMKRVLYVLLCLLMAVSLLPGAALATESETAEETVAAEAEPAIEETLPAEAAEKLTEDEPVEGERYLEDSGTCGDNLTWTLDDAGTLTISGSGEMRDCPYYYAAPWQDSEVKKVIIKAGVTSIGARAFYDCYSLTSISIPSSVTSIGHESFSGCSSLTSISIPDSVTSIESRAFSGCSSLTSISVASGNTAYASQNGILYNKAVTDLICCPVGKVGKVSIPAGVTSIESRAFSGCSSLTDVYYAGTEEQWNDIDIHSEENDALTDATIHYNSQMPTPIVGDVDGDGKVALADVSLIYRFLTGEATGVDASAADITGDGEVTLRDVAALFKLCQK